MRLLRTTSLAVLATVAALALGAGHAQAYSDVLINQPMLEDVVLTLDGTAPGADLAQRFGFGG